MATTETYTPAPLTSAELDGPAATLRFLRHLARHMLESGTKHQKVENVSFDSTCGESGLRADIGIVELSLKPPTTAAAAAAASSDKGEEKEESCTTKSAKSSRPDVKLISWTGDSDEVLRAVPKLGDATTAPGTLFLPLTSCIMGHHQSNKKSSKSSVDVAADDDEEDTRFKMLALAAAFPQHVNSFLPNSNNSNDDDAKKSDIDEAVEAAKRFVERHGSMIVMFLRSMQAFPTRDIEPPRRVPDSPTPTDIDETITCLFEQDLLKRRMGKKKDHDHWDKGGRDAFKTQIHRYTGTNRRILFLLPAFPFKSSNTQDKVLSAMPDQGEFLAIKRLDDWMKKISTQVYPPGAHLVLFSDGRVYNAEYRISDDATTNFKNAVRSLYPAQYITWSDLDEFFADATHDDKRAALEGLFGATPERVNARIADDPDFGEVYLGFKAFMSCDLKDHIKPTGLKDGGVNTQLRLTARALMRRNFAYGVMMRVLFREHVRFSIHPSSNGRSGLQGGAKFSVNMVGATDWGTPWHNCALKKKDGSWELIRRSEAERRGYALVYSEDKGLPYFTEEEEEEEVKVVPAAAAADVVVVVGKKTGKETEKEKTEAVVVATGKAETAGKRSECKTFDLSNLSSSSSDDDSIDSTDYGGAAVENAAALLEEESQNLAE